MIENKYSYLTMYFVDLLSLQKKSYILIHFSKTSPALNICIWMTKK